MFKVPIDEKILIKMRLPNFYVGKLYLLIVALDFKIFVTLYIVISNN